MSASDQELIDRLDAATAGMAPPKSDADLARDLHAVAESAGIKLPKAQGPAKQAMSAPQMAAAIKEQLRREVQAELTARLNEADERVWAAQRAEQRAERARQALAKIQRDSAADAAVARRDRRAAEESAAKATEDLTAAESKRRDATDQVAKSAESVKGMERLVTEAEERARKAEAQIKPAIKQALALLEQANGCSICSEKPLTAEVNRMVEA
jgi:hypothetical protein